MGEADVAVGCARIEPLDGPLRVAEVAEVVGHGLAVGPPALLELLEDLGHLRVVRQETISGSFHKTEIKKKCVIKIHTFFCPVLFFINSVRSRIFKPPAMDSQIIQAFAVGDAASILIT